MSAALADQQRALLHAIAQERHASAFDAAEHLVATDRTAGHGWQRGLLAYRSNAHEIASRALAGAYPVVAALLGEENFQRVARRLWAQQPPLRGDLAQWGEALAECLQHLPGLAQEEPYLPDVARIEWALHAAASAADASQDAASLALLGAQDAADITLVLSPASWTLASAYPVVSINQAHLTGTPTLEEAGRRLRGGHPETAVVWRDALRPRARLAEAGEAQFIVALQENRSLSDSLAAAPGFDFTRWLVPAFQSGLVTGARHT